MTRPCKTAVSTVIGTKSTPMPRKSGSRLTYMTPAAESSWPQCRRRAMRSGATGVQVARSIARRKIASSRAIASNTISGLRSSRIRPDDPLATALQKKSVAPVPKRPPVGTA